MLYRKKAKALNKVRLSEVTLSIRDGRVMTVFVKKQNQIVLPESLRPGDAIGIAAPAGSFDADQFRRGIKVIEALGFKTVIPGGLFEQRRYLAGSDEHRAGILNGLFADNAVKAIMCARGGFGSLKLLSLLDYAAIRNNPKIFAGFSDITALLSVIGEKTGLVTFHAPVITSLADAGEKTTAALASAFMSVEAIEITIEAGAIIAPGLASGAVRGGNLAALCQLVGTPYQPNFRESILLLEDVNEPAYRIDRMLSQMRLAGCLEGVAGILLGRFDRCGDIQEIYDVIRDGFTDSIPILAGLPVGHNGENLPLPLGLTATLDADRARLRYHSPAVLPGAEAAV